MFAVLITPHLSRCVIQYSLVLRRPSSSSPSLLLLGGVAPQIGIVDVFLGNETRPGLTYLLKRFAFEVSDDLVEYGSSHRVRILPNRGVLSSGADAIERSWGAI